MQKHFRLAKHLLDEVHLCFGRGGIIHAGPGPATTPYRYLSGTLCGLGPRPKITPRPNSLYTSAKKTLDQVQLPPTGTEQARLGPFLCTVSTRRYRTGAFGPVFVLGEYPPVPNKHVWARFYVRRVPGGTEQARFGPFLCTASTGKQCNHGRPPLSAIFTNLYCFCLDLSI